MGDRVDSSDFDVSFEFVLLDVYKCFSVFFSQIIPLIVIAFVDIYLVDSQIKMDMAFI